MGTYGAQYVCTLGMGRKGASLLLKCSEGLVYCHPTADCATKRGYTCYLMHQATAVAACHGL